MKLNIKDEVKKFMFLEDKTFKSKFKEECFQDIRIEEFRQEASFKI